jgi:hypothetical protein
MIKQQLPMTREESFPENKKRRGKCNKTQLQFYEC